MKHYRIRYHSLAWWMIEVLKVVITTLVLILLSLEWKL